MKNNYVNESKMYIATYEDENVSKATSCVKSVDRLVDRPKRKISVLYFKRSLHLIGNSLDGKVPTLSVDHSWYILEILYMK